MHASFEQTSGASRRARPASIASIILDDMLSIEASFILFIFAGRYKALPEFSWIPVDLTLLFFVLTFGLIAWGVFSGRLKPLAADLPNLLMLGFSALAIVSVFWSSFEPRNVDKAWRFGLLTAPSFFFAAILAQDRVRRERLVRMMIAFSAALMLYYAYYRWVVGIDQSMLFNTGRIQGNNYLEYGAHAGILFFAGLAVVVYGPGRWLAAGLCLTVVSLFALVLIGARGPMLFALLGIPLVAVGLFLSRRKFFRGIKRMVVLLAVLVAMAWAGYVALIAVQGVAGATDQLYTLQRFDRQMSNENTHSLDVRAEGRDLAFRRWLEQPLLGWGLGEFRIQHSLDYPHNLSLEILMETGLAGGLLFFPLLAIGVLACVRIARSGEADWVDAMIALLFLTEFLSHTTVQGYLAEDRIYLAFLAMALALRGARARRPAPTAPAAIIVSNLPTGAGAR